MSAETTEKFRIEERIRSLLKEWSQQNELKASQTTKTRYSGPSVGPEEYEAMINAIFSDWWSGGQYTLEAERGIAEMAGHKFSLLTNSGSSANLLLMTTAREMHFEDGDKIATLSCGFPTTVNPIFTNRLIPVFLDIDLETLALSPQLLDEAVAHDPAIKGVFVAHTIGFAGDVSGLEEVCSRRGVRLFCDSCDAYGTIHEDRPLASRGDASTASFYVAHHLTMGEGGALMCSDPDFYKVARGVRNWGRYCSMEECCIRSKSPNAMCPTTKLSPHCDLPPDYNVNYQYEWLGYNLKPLELQAAMLSEQLKKLPLFNQIRRSNYLALHKVFSESGFDFKLWDLAEGVSPFSFPLLLPKDAPFSRRELVEHLTSAKIETRMLFGGNLMRHPAYQKRRSWWESYGSHENADTITERFLMLGTAPVITPAHLERVSSALHAFFSRWKS